MVVGENVPYSQKAPVECGIPSNQPLYVKGQAWKTGRRQESRSFLGIGCGSAFHYLLVGGVDDKKLIPKYFRKNQPEDQKNFISSNMTNGH